MGPGSHPVAQLSETSPRPLRAPFSPNENHTDEAECARLMTLSWPGGRESSKPWWQSYDLPLIATY